MPYRFRTLLIFLFVTTAAFAQKKFEVNDLVKLVGISDPQISPDAKSIAIIVSRADTVSNTYKTELSVVDIATGAVRPLTFDRQGLTQPRWSPDGSTISFVARAASGTNQLYALSMIGGEAKQITNAPNGVQHYSWSPNGASIAYVTADDGPGKEMVRKGYDAFEIRNNDMFLSAARQPAHIWLIPVTGGEAKRMTSGSWSLPVTIPPGPPSSPLSWSADSKQIVFVKVISSYSGDNMYRSTQILNVADGSIKPLTTRDQMEGYPTYSQDGSKLTYWYTREGTRGNINDIWVTSATGGIGKNATLALDRDIYRAIWMPDGKTLLIGGHDDNRTSLWLQPLDGAAKKLNLGRLSPNWSFWVDMSVGQNGSIAFTATDPDTPTELYYMASATAAPKRLTNFNEAVRSMSLGKTETIRWELEGFSHSGSLTYPTDYTPGKKYPLVLIVHGGPNAASIENFAARSQLFANKGYFVFEPNYRGSDNLGSKYKLAIAQDAGAGPGRDVMAGVNKLINTGMIDSTKMAVTGWSYGGYMTAWLAGNYDVWKAAVAGAAVTELNDQYNLSDGNVNWGKTLGSPYKGNMQKYVDQSPITYAHKTKAPTLILANTDDPRVPVTQSYKLYHALMDNGVTTRFIAWPLPAHNASDPIRQREVSKYWMAWVDKYLKGINSAEGLLIEK